MSVKIAGDVTSGNVLIVEGQPVVVLTKEYNKSGRNAAVIKVRMKNLITNRIIESVYKADDKLEGVILEKKNCTYSYFAAPSHVFVDSEFNQYEIDSEVLADVEKYLAPEMTDICEVTFYDGRPISVVLPRTIIREVEYTEPAARGDTSGKVMKPATLKDTKHELQVSAFVEIGDKIEIDTISGEFKRRCT
jgi:elongation factor P